MGLTRRDFLTLGIGAAAAVPLTPIPWKLLDDTAKWSQNWSWIPRPPRGERSVRYGTCTLCPAGCGIQARCVGKNLIGIAPVAAHPVSHGALCPYAFGAHQLPYHPARITQPLRHGNPASLDTVVAEIAARAKAGAFAILDERPGRAVSAAYQRLAAAHGGLYLVADHTETTTLQHFADGSGRNLADLGLALENVRTLVSFGAPVLESWATPGRVFALWKSGQLEIVQVEAELSKSAALASQWLPARAGSETYLASLLAGAIGIAEAAERTGVRSDKLAGAMRFIHDRGPWLAVSGGGFPLAVEQSIAGLNAGSGAIVARAASSAAGARLARVPDASAGARLSTVPDASVDARLSHVPDASVDVLFIDHGLLGGSVSFDSLRSKVRRGGIVVSLSPYRAGVAALANFVIPTPAFAESLDEAPTPWDAVSPSYALAPALLDPPAGATTALDFINRVTGGDLPPEAAIRAKVGSLFAARRGEVFTFADRATRPVTEFKSAPDLFKAFSTGACWIDRDAKTVAVNYRPVSAGPEARVVAPTRGTAISPPLFTKLDQESRIGRA